MLQFIVINYSTFFIAFVSGGIGELLYVCLINEMSLTLLLISCRNSFPIKTKQPGPAIGQNIFQFLINHGTGSGSWEFKSAVKNALKAGQATSLEMQLCAKPTMGFEKFLLHWT